MDALTQEQPFDQARIVLKVQLTPGKGNEHSCLGLESVVSDLVGWRTILVSVRGSSGYLDCSIT